MLQDSNGILDIAYDYKTSIYPIDNTLRTSILNLFGISTPEYQDKNGNAILVNEGSPLNLLQNDPSGSRLRSIILNEKNHSNLLYLIEDETQNALDYLISNGICDDIKISIKRNPVDSSKFLMSIIMIANHNSIFYDIIFNSSLTDVNIFTK